MNDIQAMKVTASEFFHAYAERFAYLRDRWQDEHEYEDFGEYEKTAREAVEQAGGKFLALRKRPFALLFVFGGFGYRMKVKGSEVIMEHGGKL